MTKFRNYINEITDLQEEEVDEILDAGFEAYTKAIKPFGKFRFGPIVLGLLTAAFKKFGIWFLTERKASKVWDKSTNAATQMKHAGRGRIFVKLKKEDFKNLKKGNIEKFRKKLKATLMHEMIHRKQAFKLPKEVPVKGSLMMELGEYYGSPREIEAYARESAYEMINTHESTIFMSYYLMKNEGVIDKKAWQRFLKTFYYYMKGHHDLVMDAIKVMEEKYNKKKETERLKKEISKVLGPDWDKK